MRQPLVHRLLDQLCLRWRQLSIAVLLLSASVPYGAAAQEILCPPEMHVTEKVFGPEIAGISSAIDTEVGANVRPAEWSQIKACYERFGLSYFHKLGVGRIDANNPNRVDKVFVLVNGDRYSAGTGRPYFAAFHEGIVPPNWLVHDQVGGNQISLGSWTLRLPVLYVACNITNGNCPAIHKVALPAPFVTPPSRISNWNWSDWKGIGVFALVVLGVGWLMSLGRGGGTSSGSGGSTATVSPPTREPGMGGGGYNEEGVHGRPRVHGG